MSVHDGHRERLKERYLAHGLDNFNDINLLELLLFYAIPRRDTNELAHALMDSFGSLEKIFEASVRELEAVPGIGRNSAILISLVPQITRRYMISKGENIHAITNSTEAGKYLVPRLMFEKEERALLLCLDAKKHVIACVDLGGGVVNAIEINVRKVVEIAVRNRASSVILAHNHPDGIALPSREDEDATTKIISALRLVGIALDDHIIVAGEDFVSFRDSGMIGLYVR